MNRRNIYLLPLLCSKCGSSLKGNLIHMPPDFLKIMDQPFRSNNIFPGLADIIIFGSLRKLCSVFMVGHISP